MILVDIFKTIPNCQGVTLVPLTAAESLGKGELVGIGLAVDPAPACLLRVVLVRGQGDEEGVPFSHDICPTNYAPVSATTTYKPRPPKNKC